MNVHTRKTAPRLFRYLLSGSLAVSLASFTPLSGGAYASSGLADHENSNKSNAATTNVLNEENLYRTEDNAKIDNEVLAIQVRGQVVDSEDGEGIPGVTVRIKGRSGGTVTDVFGNFSIEVPSGESVLVISAVGYVTQEIRVGNQTDFNITMEPDVQALEEVVVVGYGTQKKRDVTSAVASIGGERIAERGTVSPLQAVQGQVAGVDISAGSGRAGAAYNIQIRGQNSLQGGQQPLFVVDGVIVDNIDFLNPQDIEQFDVLKDASSTAVYGSRGSNGVVQITTKQGAKVKEGASISYDGYVGVRQNVRHPNFMDGDDWFRFRQNAFMEPSPAGDASWLTNNFYKDVEWPHTNATMLRVLEDADAEFFEAATAEDIWALTIGENDEDHSGRINGLVRGNIILFQSETGRRGLIHFEEVDQDTEEFYKDDIFTVDVKVAEPADK